MQLPTVKNSVQWCCASESSFPTSAFNFSLSHDLSDGNPTLWSDCITSWILSRWTLSSGLTSSYGSSAEDPLDSSWGVLLSTLWWSSWISDVIATWCSLSVVLGFIGSVCWCSLFTIRVISFFLHSLQPLLALNLAYLICKPVLSDLCKLIVAVISFPQVLQSLSVTFSLWFIPNTQTFLCCPPLITLISSIVYQR